MPQPSSEVAPIEIWERILQESISFDSNLALEATCAPDTYLAFKKTCRDGTHYPSMVSYVKSEDIRQTLRRVCRAWKAFLDDARYRDRWVRLLPRMDPEERIYSTWGLPSRIDLDFRRIAISKARSHFNATDTIVDWFRTWRTIRNHGEGGMRLVRLDMPTISVRSFDPIFEAFCEASEALRLLRSLSIMLPTHNTWVLEALSKRFPKLTHLILGMRFKGSMTATTLNNIVPQPQTNPTQRPDFAFSLNHLEVLFLRPQPGCFNLTLWVMPQLHTFAINPLVNDWKTSIYPFLQRHGKGIESLDLEGSKHTGLTIGSTQRDVILPIDFWEDFDYLHLLRMNLRYTVFPGFPKAGHPLRWLVDTNPEVLEQSVRGHEVGESQILALYQQYINTLSIGDLGTATRDFLQTLKLNGVNVISSNGEPLIE